MRGGAIESLTGTLEDVRSFFRVSPRTMVRWNAERPPRIAFWRMGKHLAYGGEDVARFRAAYYHASGRLGPEEALELARREWREHLELRAKAENGKRKAEHDFGAGLANDQESNRPDCLPAGPGAVVSVRSDSQEGCPGVFIGAGPAPV